MNNTLLFLFLFLFVSHAKVIQKSVAISAFRRGFGWFYLSKITLSPGVSTINFTTTISGIPTATLQEVQLSLVEDTEWEEELQEKCNRRPRNSYNHTLKHGGIATTSNTELNLDKEHIYYFVLRDCRSRLTNNYTNMNVNLDITLIVLNNQSHLGEEQDNWIIFPIVFASTLWIVLRMKRGSQFDGSNEKDYAQSTLLWGIITRTVALGFKAIGYLCYVYNGWEFIMFDIGYLAFHSISETIIITALIFIAFGWTITFISADDFDIFIPLACLVGFIKMVINVLGLLNEETHEKYHMYDSIPGLITIILRVMVYCLFLSGMIYSCKQFAERNKNFLISFFTLGSIYILCLPLMIGVTYMFVNKIKQEEFVFVGTELFQILSNLILTYMITSKKSLYSKVALKNTSFLSKNRSPKKF